MTTSSGPIHAPLSSSADPGIGRPVVALLMVFVIGLLCVALIYAIGEPVGEVVVPVTTEEKDVPAKDSSDPSGARANQGRAAGPGRAYTSAGGTNPMPRHGEAAAPPIPPTTLIDDTGYDAPPPVSSTLPDPEGPVPWDEAHKYLERVITVKGTIVDTNNIGNICFLNYDPEWQDKFYIAMFKEAFELLPDPPEDHYLNKTLLVTGKVLLHRDRPQIEVYDVSQIEVVE